MTTETRYAVVFDVEEAELTALFSRELPPRSDTIRCAECDKVIRQGGTGTTLELCRDCDR